MWYAVLFTQKSSFDSQMCAVAQDALEFLLVRADSLQCADTLIHTIETETSNIATAILFQLLAFLVANKFARVPGQLLTHVLHPLLVNSQLLHTMLSNPLVTTRKAVYDFLMETWDILGDSQFSVVLDAVTRPTALLLQVLKDHKDEHRTH